jgi:cephalosporin hydroxylase
MRIKTPFDIVLYEQLVWELRPRTILEFGSLQGGGALWLADLLDAHAVEGAKVHSFDLMIHCVSPRAKHPRLEFHSVDLFKLETLDSAFLARLPHPWLVVDDSHVNVLALLRHVDRFVEVGDYYVLEDLGLAPGFEFVEGLRQACALGYAIDTDYTDAFGYNVTAAPNGWLRKMRKA